MCLISQNKVLETYPFTLAKTHKEKAATINLLAAVFLTGLLVGSGIAQTVHNLMQEEEYETRWSTMDASCSTS